MKERELSAANALEKRLKSWVGSMFAMYRAAKMEKATATVKRTVCGGIGRLLPCGNREMRMSRADAD